MRRWGQRWRVRKGTSAGSTLAAGGADRVRLCGIIHTLSAIVLLHSNFLVVVFVVFIIIDSFAIALEIETRQREWLVIWRVYGIQMSSGNRCKQSLII